MIVEKSANDYAVVLNKEEGCIYLVIPRFPCKPDFFVIKHTPTDQGDGFHELKVFNIRALVFKFGTFVTEKILKIILKKEVIVEF